MGGGDKRNQKRVCVLGSGNGGTALAKIIAANCANQPGIQDEVTMYVYEEMIDGKKLSDMINETHENVKYLPGKSLGNVVAVADLNAAAKDADILVFTFPHRQIATVCAALLGKVKPTALGVVMVKGIEMTANYKLELPSRVIGHLLRINTCVLTGFNFPSEAIEAKLCETSISCKSKATQMLLTALIQTETLRVVFVDDPDTIELIGTLRTVVGCAAGITDGLDEGYNCKAAIFRMGLIEMVKFLDLFYPNVRLATVFESCALADLLISCFFGRDRRVAEAFVRTRLSLEEVEQELLNGHKLEGARVAKDVYRFLRRRELGEVFPLFTAVYQVLFGEMEPGDFLPSVRSHPEHNLRLQRMTW